MKKLLSVLLTLSMLLTLLIVPISAGGTEPENSDEFTPVDLGTAETPKNTTTEGGVEYYTDANSVKYIVIRDADDFKAMTGTNNYIFANNIDLSTDSVALKVAFTASALISGWYGILDGNGYALTGFEINGHDNGLFRFTDDTKDVTFKNISFGTDSAKIAGKPSGNNSNGILAGKSTVNSMTISNCTAYINFNESSKASMGAFIGQPTKGDYFFTSCKTYGTINGKNKNGGFIGNLAATSGTYTFTDCENHVDIACGNQGNGGFVGQSQNSGPIINMTRCVNYGDISINTEVTPLLGGFVGMMKHSGSFANCSNEGNIATPTASGALSGIFVGTTTVPNDISFTFTDANQSLNGLLGSHPYGTKTTRGNVLFSKTVSGLQTLAAAKAAYFQTAAGSAEGLQNVRVLLALPESEIANIKNIEFKVVFKNLNVAEGATTKTLTVTDADAAIASYYSVIADTKIAEAPEGYVMVAVVVTDVDTSVWTASGANLEVYMTSAGGTNTIYNNTPEAENKNP